MFSFVYQILPGTKKYWIYFIVICCFHAELFTQFLRLETISVISFTYIFIVRLSSYNLLITIMVHKPTASKCINKLPRNILLCTKQIVQHLLLILICIFLKWFLKQSMENYRDCFIAFTTNFPIPLISLPCIAFFVGTAIY